MRIAKDFLQNLRVFDQNRYKLMELVRLQKGIVQLIAYPMKEKQTKILTELLKIAITTMKNEKSQELDMDLILMTLRSITYTSKVDKIYEIKEK